MIVEVIDKLFGTPLRLNATQVTIRTDEGAVIALAAAYGPPGGILVTHCNDADFNEQIQKFGLSRITVEARVLDARANGPVLWKPA